MHTDSQHHTGKQRAKVRSGIYLQNFSYYSAIRFLRHLRCEDGDFEETICGGQTCVLWRQLCWRSWEDLQETQNHRGSCERVSEVSEAWFFRDQDHSLWFDLITSTLLYIFDEIWSFDEIVSKLQTLVDKVQELFFSFKPSCDSKRAKNAALSLLPIIGWMRIYRVREWLLGDVVSGISTGLVAIMQGEEQDGQSLGPWLQSPVIAGAFRTTKTIRPT